MCHPKNLGGGGGGAVHNTPFLDVLIVWGRGTVSGLCNTFKAKAAL